MSDKAKYGIIAIVVVAAIFGIYAAFAKTETITDPTQEQHGGIGNTILCTIYPPACLKK